MTDLLKAPVLRVCLFSFLVFWNAGLPGAQERCGNRWLDIDADTEIPGVSSVDICERATWALDEMKRCGFSINERLRVEVVENLEHPCGIPVAGKFDPYEFRVQMASPNQCRRLLANEDALAKVNFDAFYGSVVVHEVVHAVLWKQLGDAGIEKISSIATEYIAYAFQIAALPEPDRDRILEEFLRGPPSDLSPFNSVALLINPIRFATNAYRHLMSVEDPCRFLRGILAGEVEFDDWYQYE